jgi:pimeloyl-ACP methyl ester carboxylesterase
LLFHGCHLSSHREGQGPPVIFIQGVGVHGRGWTPQVEDLRADYECLTFDNRGMGASQPVGAPLTVEQMAADTLWLMDCAGWESAHVVAHSMGGPIAIEMALTSPDRVRSLALLCTVARGRDATTMTGRLLWLGLRSRIGTRRMRRRAFLDIIMPPGALRGVDRDALAAHLEPLFGHDLAEQPPIAMTQLSALRAYDATDRLARLAGIHTLVMSAAHDPIAPPKYGRRLAAGIPDARYIEFSDASHGLPLSHPARVNELLRGHLREAVSAGSVAPEPG